MKNKQEIEPPQSFVGMSMKGGRQDNFYFCLVEYFKKEKRWFLHSVLKAADEELLGTHDDIIRSWMEENNVSKLIVDFPLSYPLCHSCQLECPGLNLCPVPDIREVEKISKDILNEDLRKIKAHPKTYEKIRLEEKKVLPRKNFFDNNKMEAHLSKTLKRKLKKGFLPYWNRTVDLWIWLNYYDLLLKYFNTSYDSMGSTSLMTLSRFSYVKRHFPGNLHLYEGHNLITLIELLRAQIISEEDLLDLKDFECCYLSRKRIIKKIEKNLNIFIYDQDYDIIVKNPRAFDSFLLAVIGKNIFEKKVKEIPDWTNPSDVRLIIPTFI